MRRDVCVDNRRRPRLLPDHVERNPVEQRAIGQRDELQGCRPQRGPVGRESAHPVRNSGREDEDALKAPTILRAGWYTRPPYSDTLVGGVEATLELRVAKEGAGRMMSKWLLGVLATAGLGAGFVLAGPPRGHPPTFGSAAEAEQLYQRAVALNAQESHLQQLLGFANAELARPRATGSAAAPAPQSVLVSASPSAGPAAAGVVAPAVAASPGVTPNPARDDDHDGTAHHHHDGTARRHHHDDGTAHHHDDGAAHHHHDDEAEARRRRRWRVR